MISSPYIDLFERCLNMINSLNYTKITSSNLTGISKAINNCLKLCKDDKNVYPQFFRLLDEKGGAPSYLEDLLDNNKLEQVAKKINHEDLDRICQGLHEIGEMYFGNNLVHIKGPEEIEDEDFSEDDPELYDLFTDVCKSSPNEIKGKFTKFYSELMKYLNDDSVEVNLTRDDLTTIDLLKSVDTSNDSSKIKLGINLFRKDIEKLVIKVDDFIYGLYYIIEHFNKDLNLLEFTDKGVFMVNLENINSINECYDLPDESEVLGIAILMNDNLYLFDNLVYFYNIKDAKLLDRILNTVQDKFHLKFTNNLIINGFKYNSILKDLSPIEILYKEDVDKK